MSNEEDNVSRRAFLATSARVGAVAAIGGLIGSQLLRGLAPGSAQAHTGGAVWQLDPFKCIQCDKCATECVLDVSAVKCVKTFGMCGYCKICWAYLADSRSGDNEAAENQRCPTNAIQRRFVEEQGGTMFYEYTVDEKLCIGCALCVKACKISGNKAMYLQVRHDRCLNCNRCAIAAACPADAFRRVPADQAYRLKDGSREE